MNRETFFAEVPDVRLNRRKKYVLPDILAITSLAVICGADDYQEITLYGQLKQALRQTVLNLDKGIPSHDTVPEARL